VARDFKTLFQMAVLNSVHKSSFVQLGIFVLYLLWLRFNLWRLREQQQGITAIISICISFASTRIVSLVEISSSPPSTYPVSIILQYILRNRARLSSWQSCVKGVIGSQHLWAQRCNEDLFSRHLKSHQWWSPPAMVGGPCALRAGIGMTINLPGHPKSVTRHLF